MGAVLARVGRFITTSTRPRVVEMASHDLLRRSTRRDAIVVHHVAAQLRLACGVFCWSVECIVVLAPD